MVDFEHYHGGEMCHHGREVATDDDPCPYEGSRIAEDDTARFILCGQHHQKFVGGMAARRITR